MIRKFIFLMGLLGVTQMTYCQTFEHTIEFGPMVGGSFYLGDANNTPFTDIKPLLGGLIRYPLNNRLALKGTVMLSGVKGYSDTYQVAFDHLYAYAALHGEFNFFPYERTDFEMQSSIITPYILGGVGYIYSQGQSQNSTMTIAPISPTRAVVLSCGVGGKMKISSRVDLNVEWTINKALSDRLEGVAELNNSYLLNQNMTFNNDFFSTFTVAVTFAIFTQKCECHGKAFKGY
jgi:hypothetical protein